VYPFEFELIVTYRLSERSVFTGLQVMNRSAEDMFFSIGGHPAFNCPIFGDDAFEDYEIVLNEEETTGNRLLTPDGLVSDKTAPFFNNSSIIPLDYAVFKRHGTLVFKNLNSTMATLRSRKTGAGVTLDFTGFQYFAVWTKPDAPFVCLEPWLGLCDSSFYSGNFRGKTGNIQLAAGAYHSCGFTITPSGLQSTP
jgi:galactose mutarotase-like enzyme